MSIGKVLLQRFLVMQIQASGLLLRRPHHHLRHQQDIVDIIMIVINHRDLQAVLIVHIEMATERTPIITSVTIVVVIAAGAAITTTIITTTTITALVTVVAVAVAEAAALEGLVIRTLVHQGEEASNQEVASHVSVTSVHLFCHVLKPPTGRISHSHHSIVERASCLKASWMQD